MKKVQLYGMLIAVLITTACNPDSVDEIKFDVRTDQATATCKVGQPLTFLFDGNAQYITFFSGEPGNCYANIGRTHVDIASLQLKSTIKQQYTDREYRNKEIVYAYVSEDFNGEYTLKNIQAATWEKISGREYNQVTVPLTRDNVSEEVSSIIELSAYKDRPFYVAFQYNAFKRNDVPTADGNGRYVVQPRVDVKPLSLVKTTIEGMTVVWDNPLTDWAFRVIYQQSAREGNYKVDDTSLLFQPQKGKEHTDQDVVVWMVSRAINPGEVEPDRGTAIKSTDAYLPAYTHTYAQPGEYTATFIATNANLWNNEQIVKEITITVTE